MSESMQDNDFPAPRWKAGDFEGWAPVYTVEEVRSIVNAERRASRAEQVHHSIDDALESATKLCDSRGEVAAAAAIRECMMPKAEPADSVLQSNPAVSNAGWKWLPVEPTLEMLMAAEDAWDEQLMARVVAQPKHVWPSEENVELCSRVAYRAILAAAPAAPFDNQQPKIDTTS